MNTNPNSVLKRKRWFIAFDNQDHYEVVARGLQEVGEDPEGFLTVCPDNVSRMTIEVKPEFVGQFAKFTLGGQKLHFLVMTKGLLPDEDLVFARVSTPKKIQVSEPVFGVIKGSSLLRKQCRHKKSKTKSKMV